MSEAQRLNEIAKDFCYADKMNTIMIEYCGNIFIRHMAPFRWKILEMGPAEGVMTDILYPLFPDNYTVIDGAAAFIEDLAKRYPKIKTFTGLFEDFDAKEKYDYIVLGHVLEHVLKPVDILKKCREWLADGGMILSSVPNRNSIHRQAGVEMGLLQNLGELNDSDIQAGHRRVYSWDEFISDFESAELKIIEKGGYWLKPLSHKQLENWTADMLNAFFKLGEKYPDIAAEMYIIAAKN